MRKKRKPAWNKLGVRSYAVASEEIACAFVEEQRSDGGESTWICFPSITIVLSDGTVLESYREVFLRRAEKRG